MTAERNVEVVQEVYAAVTRSDLDALASLVAEDAEYVNPDYASEPGTRRGRDGFIGAFRSLLDSFSYSDVHAEQVVSEGERVLVRIRARAEGRESGVKLTLANGHVWDLRDERIVRFEWFRSFEEAQESVRRNRIRELYSAVVRGELDVVDGAIAPDAVFVNPPDAVEPGIRRGREEVVAALRGGLAVFNWSDLDPTELLIEGEHALAVVEARGTGQDSGAVVEARFAHSFEFRDGLMVRFEWSRDVEAARREFMLRSGSSGDH